MLQINNFQLKQFYEKCQKDKLIGIDTEFYRVDTYYPKLCLIQLSNTDECMVIDPIENNLEMDFLRKILFNTKIKKVLHAARQDIEIFYNIFKKIPMPIYDTQIALLALGFPHSTSYATACRDLLQIKIDKKNQFIDWRKRPLNYNKIAYAINDVKFLLPLFHKINKEMELKNTNVLKPHYKKIINIDIYSKRAENAWEKIKFNNYKDIDLNKLKKICFIREKLAMKKNVPIKQIISNSDIKILSKKNIKKKNEEKILMKLKVGSINL